MKLHKFTATTFTQAMNRVRKELGEDAIIVSSIEERGLFHITAAIESDFDTGRKSFDRIYESLDEHGLGELTKKQIKDLIRSLEHKIPEPSECLAASLDQILHFNPFDLENLKDGAGVSKSCPIALIGPPGAGKTACIAKLAIEATVLDLNPIVITLDAEKAGAIAQLTSFTNALAIPFEKADTKEELSEHITTHNGLVLLDTTGLNPYDDNQIAFAKEMLSHAAAIIVLVMPAGLDMQEAQDMIKVFKTLNPSYLIVTKIDMCRRFGNVMGLSIYSGLPLSYFGHSPHISSPLIPFTPIELAQMIQFKNSFLVK
ncbi:hypothetical protein [Candidatus Bodocaedibacter vickermanii]|uniref:Flagellar biosynthesis protein FlhF n=1 Tax=Candidatus Bodocaedibacter vickermanii TaxID=2741701 RepID=A0A7L9RUE9_9PROT|nr:Flagellar biosynthesis protein FlhF [Candidatus Paracaedibacteraceae bacterium 'Lake Konstanz']